MKSYATLAVILVLGCGAQSTRSSVATHVVIPKAPQPPPEPPSEAPEPIVPEKPRFQIAIGGQRVCVRIDAKVHCWIRSAGLQPPIGVTTLPIAGVGDVVDVAVGDSHACTLNRAGQVFCWGDNSAGQLGAGRLDETLTIPVRAGNIEGAKAISCGTMHTCALLGDGRVSCWGRNDQGQTGSDVEYSSDARELVEPEIVPEIADATAVVAGRDQSCAFTKTGVWCWGYSHLESQSQKRGTQSNIPFKVTDLADAEQLSFYGESSCGLFKYGHIACWGSGAFSILPSRPLRAEHPLPVTIPAAKHLAISSYHGCALLQDGHVSCWGWNNHGELGREPQEDYNAHESGIVKGLPPHVDSVAVGLATSCAVVQNREIWCWGVQPHEPWVHGAGSGVPMRLPIE